MEPKNRDDTLVWWRSEAIAWSAAVIVMIGLSVGVVALRPNPAGSAATDPAATPGASAIPVFRDGGPNLLANASFEVESATPGVAEKWARTEDNASYSLDARSRYGERSQRISKTGTADPLNQYSAVQQSFASAVGGALYVVSVDYIYAFESGKDATRSVGIVVYCLDSNGRFIDDGTAVDWGWPPASDWTRKSLTFRAPSQTSTLIVQFRISVNGSLSIDGAQLTQTSAVSMFATVT